MVKIKNKPWLALFLAVPVLSFVLSGCAGAGPGKEKGQEQPGERKLQVVASFYPMYDFASKIGGDKVEVTNLIPAGTEPHDWEPAPSDIIRLEKSDLFVYNGAGMEQWVDKVLSGLENKKLVVVEASKGITLRTGAEGGSDPHVWLSPANAKAEMENIRDGLKKADPGNASYYDANAKKYGAQLDALDKKYKEALEGLPHKDIVVAHEAFGYLCDAYGLKQLGIEGLSPDTEPDPARMAQIIDFVKKNHVKAIFFEELASPKVAKAIASATGAKAQMLNPLEGLSSQQIKAGEDYFSVMNQNLDTLKEYLK